MLIEILADSGKGHESLDAPRWVDTSFLQPLQLKESDADDPFDDGEDRVGSLVPLLVLAQAHEELPPLPQERRHPFNRRLCEGSEEREGRIGFFPCLSCARRLVLILFEERGGT
jgi:hypothetical protein